MIKKYFAFCFFLLMNQVIDAQDNVTYIGAQLLWRFGAHYDDGFSAKRYTSDGIQTGIFLERYSQNVKNRLELLFSTSYPTTSSYSFGTATNSANFNYFRFNHHIGWNVSNHSNFRYYVGPTFSIYSYGMLYKILNSNNLYDWDRGFSVNISGDVNGKINENSFWGWGSRQTFQLLGFTSRPSWVNMLPFEGITPTITFKSILKNIKISTIDRFFFLKLESEIGYRNAQNNTTGVLTQYEYHFNKSNKHRFYQSGWSNGLYSKFDWF